MLLACGLTMPTMIAHPELSGVYHLQVCALYHMIHTPHGFGGAPPPKHYTCLP